MEFERLDRKVDRIQNDILAIRNELASMRTDSVSLREELRLVKDEMHSGFERLERIILKPRFAVSNEIRRRELKKQQVTMALTFPLCLNV